MGTLKVLNVVGVALILTGVGFAVVLADPLPLVLGSLFGVIYLLVAQFCHMITREEIDR